MTQTQRSIFTVSALNSAVASTLAQAFGWLWVEGEISNLAQPASGHMYFTLKDENAQVRCAMFRGRNRDLSFRPENGSQVLVRCKIGLYEVRGEYQLIIDSMEPAGDGLLRRRFEALKQKLDAEGLFDAASKQPVPALPQHIGVITSATGAALRDVLSVIRRRFPAIPVMLYPVPVQGEDAAPAIEHALQLAARHNACDVLLLVRGGGSLEDLWPFNEERVARAVFACPIPVVSGVGHEVDVSITDFVADLRAATPSAAAEAVTPDRESWMQTLDGHDARLRQLIAQQLGYRGERLEWLSRRLMQQHPEAVLQRLRERFEDRLLRMRRAMAASQRNAHSRLLQSRTRLMGHNPGARLQQDRARLERATQSMRHHIERALSLYRTRLERGAATLNALSPLQTLARGYSITMSGDGRALTDTTQLSAGRQVETRLHIGRFTSRIDKVFKE